MRVKGKGNEYRTSGKWISWDELRQKNPLSVSEPPSLEDFQNRGSQVGEGKKLKPGEWLTKEKLGTAKSCKGQSSSYKRPVPGGSNESVYAPSTSNAVWGKDQRRPSATAINLATDDLSPSTKEEMGQIPSAKQTPRRVRPSLLERFTSEEPKSESSHPRSAPQEPPTTPARQREAHLATDASKKPLGMAPISPSAADTPLCAALPLPETPPRHSFSHNAIIPTRPPPPSRYALEEPRSRLEIPPICPVTPEPTRVADDALAPRGPGLKPTTFEGPLSSVVQRKDGLINLDNTDDSIQDESSDCLAKPTESSNSRSVIKTQSLPQGDTNVLRSPLTEPGECSGCHSRQAPQLAYSSGRAAHEIEAMLLRLRNTRSNLDAGSSASRWATPQPVKESVKEREAKPMDDRDGSKFKADPELVSRLSPPLQNRGDRLSLNKRKSFVEEPADHTTTSAEMTPRASQTRKGSSFVEAFSVQNMVDAATPAPLTSETERRMLTERPFNSQPPTEPRAMRGDATVSRKREQDQSMQSHIKVERQATALSLDHRVVPSPVNAVTAAPPEEPADESSTADSTSSSQPGTNIATKELGSRAVEGEVIAVNLMGDRTLSGDIRVDDNEADALTVSQAGSTIAPSLSKHFDWADDEDEDEDELPDLGDWGVTLPMFSSSSRSAAVVNSDVKIACARGASAAADNDIKSASTHDKRATKPIVERIQREFFQRGKLQGTSDGTFTLGDSGRGDSRRVFQGGKGRCGPLRPAVPADGDWKKARVNTLAAEAEAAKARAAKRQSCRVGPKNVGNAIGPSTASANGHHNVGIRADKAVSIPNGPKGLRIAGRAAQAAAAAAAAVPRPINSKSPMLASSQPSQRKGGGSSGNSAISEAGLPTSGRASSHEASGPTPTTSSAPNGRGELLAGTVYLMHAAAPDSVAPVASAKAPRSSPAAGKDASAMAEGNLAKNGPHGRGKSSRKAYHAGCVHSKN